VIFFLSLRPDLLWVPPSLVSTGYIGLSPEVKRPGREANQSPPSSSEVKIAWNLVKLYLYLTDHQQGTCILSPVFGLNNLDHWNTEDVDVGLILILVDRYVVSFLLLMH
jgi:hypothetical protein